MKLPLSAFLPLVAISVAFGQGATTTPVGVVNVTLKANADTFVPLPFPRALSSQGKISTVQVSGIQVQPITPILTSQFVYQAGSQPNTYYFQVLSGQAKGQYATVISNTETLVATDFESSVLTQMAEGDRFAIYPYWTLGTLFPSTDAGISFTASTSNLGSGRRTEIYLPNTSGVGKNKAPSATYYFNSYWRLQGNIGANRNDDVVLPDSYLIVRGNNYPNDTILRFSGTVLENHVIPVISSSTLTNDNPIGIPIPKDMSLSDLRLLEQGVFVPSVSNLGSGRRDEIFIFDGTPVGASKNRPPNATFYYNGYWRKQGDIGPSQNPTIIPAGSVVVIRKYPTPVSSSIDWTVSLN